VLISDYQPPLCLYKVSAGIYPLIIDGLAFLAGQDFNLLCGRASPLN
jgi:hypothetical protein